jgi:glycosyltransferase involved in cell wall biosynthesis
MATRNRAHSLAGAIESARAQRFTNWELIIVDDGSTDDTKAVVARFTDDARIRYDERAIMGSASHAVPSSPTSIRTICSFRISSAPPSML